MALLELNEARRWAKKWFKVPSVVHISNILISVHQQNFQNVSRMVARFTHNASVSGFFSVQNVGNARFRTSRQTKLIFPQKSLKMCKCRSGTRLRENIAQEPRLNKTVSTSTLTVTVAAQSTHRAVPYGPYRTHLFLLELTTVVLNKNNSAQNKIILLFLSNHETMIEILCVCFPTFVHSTLFSL